MKGQDDIIESPVGTLIDLVILAFLIIIIYITLFNMSDSQRRYGTELVISTSDSVTFAQGFSHLQSNGRSVIEQALHTALAGSAKNANTQLVGLIFNTADTFGFDMFDIQIYDNFTEFEKISRWPSFCGDLSQSIMAFCEDVCSPGRITAGPASGTGACIYGTCCVEQYDFTNMQYTSIDMKLSCGPNDSGWHGVCQKTCSGGRIKIEDISQRCNAGSVCCRPATSYEFQALTFRESSITEIPLIYNNTQATLKIILGKIGVEVYSGSGFSGGASAIY